MGAKAVKEAPQPTELQTFVPTCDSEVATLLRELGFKHYTKRFAVHRITVDVLPLLTTEALDRIGVPIGDALIILSAVSHCVVREPLCGCLTWTVDQVSRWVSELGVGHDVVDAFVTNGIDGTHLVSISATELRDDLRIERLCDRRTLLTAIQRLCLLRRTHVDQTALNFITHSHPKPVSAPRKGFALPPGTYAMYIRVDDHATLQTLASVVKRYVGVRAEFESLSVVITTFILTEENLQKMNDLLTTFSSVRTKTRSLENEKDKVEPPTKSQSKVTKKKKKRKNKEEENENENENENEKEKEKENDNENDSENENNQNSHLHPKELRRCNSLKDGEALLNAILDAFPIVFMLSGVYVDTSTNTVCVGVSDGSGESSLAPFLSASSELESATSSLRLEAEDTHSRIHVNTNAYTSLHSLSAMLTQLLTQLGIRARAQEKPIGKLEPKNGVISFDKRKAKKKHSTTNKILSPVTAVSGNIRIQQTTADAFSNDDS